MLNIWNKTLKKLSGNLTTNEYMPDKIRKVLLEENLALKNELVFKKINFTKLPGILNEIKGLNILAGLQKLEKKNCLIVYRAVRFPTYKRMHEIVYDKGYAIANYEQERILELYKNKKYQAKRKKIQKDKNFWVMPQERVVKGLPVFHLVNDALQIHHAYRDKTDKVAIIAIYIPYKLLKTNKIQLISNSAIDLDYKNNTRDIEIKDFIPYKGKITIDQEILREKGVDLHEMYAKNLPWDIKGCEDMGIKQDFFLLDIHDIKDKKKINKLFQDSKTLIKNQYFLHGFFGDQNIFGRRSSRYLAKQCKKIEKNN